MVIALIIALIVSGGVGVAAQNSLPGNVLYPVKINVNEKLEGLLSVSAKAKADFEAVLASRRLQEAEELSSEGKLDDQIATDIQANFEEHANAAEKGVSDLKTDNDLESASEVAADFESSLHSHETILVTLSLKGDEENRNAIGSVIKKLDSELKDTDKVRSDVEVKIKSSKGPEVQAAAEGKMTAAQNKIDEVSKFIANANVATSTMVEAQAKLTVAKSTFAQGKIKLDAKAYGEAFVLFQNSIRLAQEAKMTLESRDELDIDVNEKGGEGEKPENQSTEVKVQGSLKTDENEATDTETKTEVNVKIGY